MYNQVSQLMKTIKNKISKCTRYKNNKNIVGIQISRFWLYKNIHFALIKNNKKINNTYMLYK